LQKIWEIENEGLEVEAFIIRSGIKSEEFAFDVEGAVIHAYRLLERGGASVPVDLTNIAEGHHPERGLASVDVMQSLLNAPPAPDIEAPVGIFLNWCVVVSRDDRRRCTWGNSGLVVRKED
jgi:hypothetical protein